MPVLVLFTMPHFRHLHLQILRDLPKVAEQIGGTAQVQASCPMAQVKWVRISHTNWELGGAPHSMHWCGIQIEALLLLLLHCKCDLKILENKLIANSHLLSIFPFPIFYFSLKDRKLALILKQNTNLKYQTQTCRPEQMLTTHRAIASGYI